ncbi:MAG: hypothetical protein NZM11_07410, partial [Anaerolineales bacterium]|nr:hypothetical protein [Anaerolineales bacterium]
ARYLADPLPRRLGALAANLARVSSSARHPSRTESVALMLEESQHFIEWAAAEAEPEVAAELVDIQVMVALWRLIWPDAQRNDAQRALLSFQAKKWSDQVLDYSGLLESA